MQINSEVYTSLKCFAGSVTSNVSACVVWLVGFYNPKSASPVVVSAVRGVSAVQGEDGGMGAIDISMDRSFLATVCPGGLQVVGLFLWCQHNLGSEQQQLKQFISLHKGDMDGVLSLGTNERKASSQIILATAKKTLQMAEFDEILFYLVESANMKELALIPQENVIALPTLELANILNTQFVLMRVSIELDLSVVYHEGDYKEKLMEIATPLMDTLKTAQLLLFVKSNGGEMESVVDTLANLQIPSKDGKIEWLDGTATVSVSATHKNPAKLYIDQTKESYQHTNTTVTLSVLHYLTASTTCEHLLRSVADQLFFQASKAVSCMSAGPNISPTIYHFIPPKFPHPITLLYPTDKTISQENDDYLASVRAAFHRQLLLPMDKPVLRFYNRLNFTADSPLSPAPNPLEKDFRLKDVHLQLQLDEGTSTGGSKFLVQGSYLYYHYQQDANDSGWGCAYRSLQTICSWLVLQGFTAKPVPSLSDIQRILVLLGDKSQKFVGSTEWIGSQEVFYCLDHLYGISAKILNVNSGAEIAQKGDELSRHFKTEGTPIMIGGGVLAYTILGVDYNASTGAIKFLILDPHYVGPENLKNIRDKWCSWKGGEIFKKDAHYNMCMPLRPKKV